MRPLYDLKGIIYMIENLVNNKKYIGQTMCSFAQRYHGCQWWKASNNRYLKAAKEKYGSEAFKVTILEHSKTLEELNRLEKKYAQRFDTYSPHGYNLVECGKNRAMHPESILLLSRTIVLNDPAGRDTTITNIAKFCRDNGLDARAIARVIKGEHASHNGWTLQGVTTKHHRNNKVYVLYESDGTCHHVTGLTTFCKKQGLHYWQMRAMTQGKTVESQGYALSIQAFNQQRKRHVVTLTKDGQEVILNNIKRDCRDLGLHSRYIYHLITGKILSYKGWMIKTISSALVEW